MEKVRRLDGEPIDDAQTSSPVSIASNGAAAPTPSGHEQPGSVPDETAATLHAKTFLAVFAVCLIYFAQLTSLVAGVQAQTIGAHFGDTSKSVWFAGSIGIFTVVLGPIVSQAADYWGRKWILALSTLGGAVGSVVVSRAESLNMVIAGFCVTGIAFGPQPLLNAIPAEILPRAGEAWPACPLVSSVFGIIVALFLGAALNRTSDPTSDGFRRYYYVAAACYLFSAIVCAVAYNPPPLPSQVQLTLTEKLRKLDWFSYLLFTAGLVLFSVGFSYSDNPYAWTDARVSATFAVGLALSLDLIFYETYRKKDGLFHHGLFSRNRNIAITLLAIFFEGLAFFAINGFFTTQVSLLYQSADALLAILPFAVVCIVAAPVAFLTGLATSARESGRAVWGFSVLAGLGFSIMLDTYIIAFRHVWTTAACLVVVAVVAWAFLIE